MDLLSVDQLLASEVETKREFRWILSVKDIPAYVCQTTERPSGKFDETEYHFINQIRYLSGKYKPDELPVTLIDPIAPSAAQAVQNWVRLNYEVTTGRMGYQDFYKTTFSLKLLDPPGGVAEQWSIKGAWPKVIGMGKLDYKSNDLVHITLSIRYDSAQLEW